MSDQMIRQGAKGHTHPNGGGWVADRASVSPDVFVGPLAQVYGGFIQGGTIHGGTIHGGTIWGGTIEGGTIHGGSIYDGNIHGGTIWGGTIEGGTIHGGIIWGGTIEGGTIHGGIIYGGTICGGIIWGGTIEGGTIWGGTIWGGNIHSGDIHSGTIRGERDVLVLGPVGSENQHITLTRDDSSRAGHRVSIGCWHPEGATVDDIAAEVADRCPDRADEYAELTLVLQRRVHEWTTA